MSDGRFFLPLPAILLAAALVVGPAEAASPKAEPERVVVKQVCVSAFGSSWKSSEDAKTMLLSLAKREAVSELFGDTIRGGSRVEDFQLKKDEVEVVTAGIVRIDGNPEFFNGSGFGEACVRARAYVAPEDRARFLPVEVNKKACYGDAKMSAEAVRKAAETQARLQAVTDFEPRLQGAPEATVLSLLHEGKVLEAGFLPGGTTYCATVSGKILPIEAATVSRRGGGEPPADARKGPEAPARGGSAVVDVDAFSLRVLSCEVATPSSVVCDISVSNRTEEEARLFLHGTGRSGFDEERADLVDSRGTRFLLKEIEIGKKKATGRFLELDQPLPVGGAPVEGRLRFGDGSNAPEGNAKLHFFVARGKVGERQDVRLSDVPVRAR